MTAISSLISRHFTAHSSDSFVTEHRSNAWHVVESEKTKLIRVQHWRGAFAFWGLATYGQWSTLDWLQNQAQRATAFSSPEDFANATAAGLEQELSRLQLGNGREKGIGIHFTAYEHINDYWIPELFLISNWEGIPYTDIRPTGVEASRETYHTLKGDYPSPEHRQFEFRSQVREALLSGTVFWYNNGDPELYSPVANSIKDTILILKGRSVLNQLDSEETHRALVRRPIEVISRLLGDFCKDDTRLIGGKPHDLSISPGGSYWSGTGD
jgi:hypothetical protein